MGLIGGLLGLSNGVRDVAEVFVENRTQRAAQEHLEHVASLSALSAEFDRPRGGWFDQLVDGLNRLPRPALATGTLGLFIYAMVDPISFGARMQGLALMPDPLWWLLGAIVSFYFGARELHHFRGRKAVEPEAVAAVAQRVKAIQALDTPATGNSAPVVDDNSALAAWRSGS